MPLYKFDILADLPDNSTALEVTETLVNAGLPFVCTDDEGNPTIIECMVHGFVPIWHEVETPVEIVPQEVADALYPDLHEHPKAAEIQAAADRAANA